MTFLTLHHTTTTDLCEQETHHHMKPNMGRTDRILRIIAALAIGVLYFTGVLNGAVGIVLLVLALVFVLTSFVSFCPLYTLFGIRTRKA